MSTCMECARLARERNDARLAGNLSRVIDCNVLIRRHPNHSKKPVAVAGESA